MTLPTLLRAATAMLALHVADDRFLQPRPGTDHDMPAAGHVLNATGVVLKNLGLGVFGDEPPPPDLETVVERIAPRPLLLLAAPDSPDGEDPNRQYHAAANEPKELWEIPESGHTGGLDARPHEYERRVAGFFDRSLGR